jgi:hypothetical protein
MRTLAATILALVGIAFAAAGTSAQSCTTATCTATDCTQANFLAALPSSGNSNSTVVVNIPACSGGTPWTGELSYTIPSAVTNLTIQGQTAINCTGTPGTSSYACSAADNTVIDDAYQNSNPILLLTTGGASTYFRMTGITWEGGNIGSTNNTKYSGMLQFYGSSQNFRIDHCHFNHETYSPANNGAAVRVWGYNQGVVDHNIFDLSTSQGSVANGLSVYSTYQDSIGYGDGAFNIPTNFGSSEFMFLENNIFNGGAAIDCANGGRYVLRYNTSYNEYLFAQTHATDTDAGGRERGCRAWEVYHNYISGGNASPSSSVLFMTNATGLVWDNIGASGFYSFAELITDRATKAYAETAGPNGWGYCGTDVNGIGSGWDGNSSISTGYPCLDGVGRGQGTQALNGADFPSALNSSTGTIAWPHEYLEPVYEWGDNFTFPYSGHPLIFTGSSEVITQNLDYYQQNSSFNGASGTGSGPLASRPSTCTAGPGGTYGASPTGSYGVAYFATDANGGVGELYVCTTTNTWTALYQPYTYPHPLEANAGPVSDNTPTPPTGLTASVQ